jgi:hypothetical protein
VAIKCNAVHSEVCYDCFMQLLNTADQYYNNLMHYKAPTVSKYPRGKQNEIKLGRHNSFKCFTRYVVIINNLITQTYLQNEFWADGIT